MTVTDLPLLRPYHPLDWLRLVRWVYFAPDNLSAYPVQHDSRSLRRTASAFGAAALLLALGVPALGFVGQVPAVTAWVGGQPLAWETLLAALFSGALLLALLGGLGDDADLGVLFALVGLVAGGWLALTLLGAHDGSVLGPQGRQTLSLLAAALLLLCSYGVSEPLYDYGGLVPVAAWVGVQIVAGWQLASAATTALAQQMPLWLAAAVATFGTLALIVLMMILFARVERRVKHARPRLYGWLKLALTVLAFALLVAVYLLDGWRLLV